jgi:acetylornithine deacetylase/succinyl-diaminopimelate desuccinylase-like protein
VSAAVLDELGELLRIPSISADPAHAADVRRAAEWVRDYVGRSGGTAELVDWHGSPLVAGEIRASPAGPSAPTVLAYGHFDVQPPDPLELWETPPFEPTVRGEWLVGRGVADDKAQLYLLLRAAGELAAEGRLPVNVRVACDGEEETGGHSIVDFLAETGWPLDAAVIFDGNMPARGVPAFYVGVRGMAYLHVRVRTGERDLHSGVYGGAALNAASALAQALRAVQPVEGRLPETLRAGIVPPTAQELADWQALQPGGQVLAEQGARPSDARAAEEFYLRTFAEPALDVNGIASGSPHLQKTVLPVLAEANLSMRLAPGQEPAACAEAIERLLREAAPAGADVEVERWSLSPAGLVDPGSSAVQLGLAAFERVLGRRPLLLRTGGSLPVVSALAGSGVPVVLTGFDVPEGNIHSPNERFLVEYLDVGLRAARELLLALGELRPG